MTIDFEQAVKGSLPSLGAWIETTRSLSALSASSSRSLHWERGLKPGLRRMVFRPIVVAPFTGSVD